MTQAPKWVIFRRVPLTAIGYTRLLGATRLWMPCRMFILLIIGVLLPLAHTSRVKRQFSPYHIQEWLFDQRFHREPHGYWQDARNAYIPGFHNNYDQRHISPHQAPPDWNPSNQYWYSYPYSGNYVQQRSISAETPVEQTKQRSSYGRPPIIKEQEIIYTHQNGRVPTEMPNAYPAVHNSGELLGTPLKSSPTDYKEITTQSSLDSDIDVVPPPPPLDEEIEASANDEKLGTDSTTNNLPTAEDNSTKPGEEDYLSSDSKKHPNSEQPAIEDRPTQIALTTINPIDEKLKPSSDDRTTSDVIIESLSTTASLPTERVFVSESDAEGSTPLFVDADELPTWTPPPLAEVTQDIISQSDSGRTIIPFIEFIPTEVPAATIPSAQPNMETSEDVESSGIEVSKEPAILRSPPLPKEVSEKLSELDHTPLETSE